MKSLKILGGAGALVAAAVVGGTLMSAVSAHPGTTTTPSTAGTVATGTQTGQYCTEFLDQFAANLGVDASALTPAAKDAAKATIDSAVANGDLPQAIGDAIKQRIDNASGTGCTWLNARWQAVVRNVVQRGIGHDMLTAAADSLNMTPADLRSAITSGESLKKIAQDQNVSYDTVTSAIHDAAKADLDKLVSAGKMTADRETQILNRLDKALQDGKLFNGNGPGPLRPGAGAQASPSTSSSAS